MGKRFRIGPASRRADTLGETLAVSTARLGARLRAFLAGQSRSGANRPDEFWALRDVDFEVPRGQVLGIIGRNGSGKSTLLKILSRITPPTEGCAEIEGRVGSLLEIGTGFHPELTGRENTFLSGTILGMKRQEISERFDEIVDFSGVERFIDTPVKHYSSGMYLRLAFAVAAHLRAEILLIDEVLSVGDSAFQKKCIGKMSEAAHEGRTVLFVSHNLPAVSRLCDRALLLDAGRIVAQGSVEEVVGVYGRQMSSGKPVEGADAGSAVGVRALTVSGEGDAIRPSSQLTFTFRLDISKVYWSMLVQLGVATQEGLNLVVDAVDSDSTPELLQPGSYEVEVILPPLWLLPQSYASRVKVIAHPESGATERCFSEWVQLTIDGSQERAGTIDRVLAPRANWRLRPARTNFSAASSR